VKFLPKPADIYIEEESIPFTFCRDKRTPEPVQGFFVGSLPSASSDGFRKSEIIAGILRNISEKVKDMSIQISNISTLFIAAALKGQKICDTEKEGKLAKVNALAKKALEKLSEGESAFAVANYIRKQSINCFDITGQIYRQMDILERMRDEVDAKQYPNVTAKDVIDVAKDLGLEETLKR
jgi:hypothetical protein